VKGVKMTDGTEIQADIVRARRADRPTLCWFSAFLSYVCPGAVKCDAVSYILGVVAWS
jgi:hypothetical protein